MNDKEAFAKAARHLLDQGKKAMNEVSLECALKTKDGLKCAVGCLIDERLYSPKLEPLSGVGSTDIDDELRDVLEKSGVSFSDLTIGMLHWLQFIHDEKGVSHWREELEFLWANMGWNAWEYKQMVYGEGGCG